MACRAAGRTVLSFECKTRPAAVVEAIFEVAEGGFDMATSAAPATIDIGGQTHPIEAPLVGVCVAAPAPLHATEGIPHQTQCAP